MAIDTVLLPQLAGCLEYPEPRSATWARTAASSLASLQPELSSALFALAVFLESSEAGEAEERYTALFDMNPVCTLHVGYHVFGDSYPRGEFLASLASELQRREVETKGELADFLPTVLRLLGRIEDGEDRRLLRELALLPALQAMSLSLVESQDPWSRVLRAMPGALVEAGDVPSALPSGRPKETPASALAGLSPEALAVPPGSPGLPSPASW